MKVLFVGDKPSRLNTDPNVAFKGAACEKRLQRWIDEVTLKTGLAAWLQESRCREEYEIINCVDKDATYIVITYILQDWPIVALGNNAAKFLASINAAPYYKLPHPSGRNRQINDRAFIMNRLRACQSYIVSKALQHRRLSRLFILTGRNYSIN